MEELKFLEEQNVSSRLIKKILEFREMYPVPDEAAGRITKPAIPFYGKEILEMAIAGLLQGQNLLLAGPKATGKNILAECAVKDRVWGIGLSMSDPDRFDLSKWKGQNLLGYALMMVRNKLSEENLGTA